MKRLASIFIVSVAMCGTTWCLANAKARSAQPQAPSQLQALSEVAAIQPGKPFTVALKMTMDDGWHSYWVNPGDAGFPLTVEWNLPKGFTVGDFQWPVPKRMEADGIIAFVYEKDATVLVTITPPKTLTVGSTVNLTGKASWLVCQTECIPASGNVALSLPVEVAERPNPKAANVVASGKGHLPTPLATGWTSTFVKKGTSYVVTVSAPDGTALPTEGWTFLPESSELAFNKPMTISVKGNVLTASIPAAGANQKPVKKIRGILVAPDATDNLSKWSSIEATIRP